MTQIEKQNATLPTDLQDWDLSKEEFLAYEEAYFNMLLDLGSNEEIQDFLSSKRDE